ncbi:MAG TPA: hypothetical protein VGZ00_00815 [Candidatus Baltobacteraceae bacterium]|jgi:hypothetical protein|nr:hypothetical protein [Candidatus Baltobacteraceae bacterium]
MIAGFRELYRRFVRAIRRWGFFVRLSPKAVRPGGDNIRGSDSKIQEDTTQNDETTTEAPIREDHAGKSVLDVFVYFAAIRRKLKEKVRVVLEGWSGEFAQASEIDSLYKQDRDQPGGGEERSSHAEESASLLAQELELIKKSTQKVKPFGQTVVPRITAPKRRLGWGRRRRR